MGNVGFRYPCIDRMCCINLLFFKAFNVTKAEKQHKDKLSRLGCAVCRRIHDEHEAGPVQLHHQRGGMGGWGKGNYKTLIPLCYEHHMGNTGVHGLGTKGFAAHYGFDESDLLADTLKQL